MKDKIAKLIDVKTIVTFAVIGVFCYLSAIGKIPIEAFMIVTTAIITFFFAKKKDDETK
jgi:hypothetical protein